MRAHARAALAACLLLALSRLALAAPARLPSVGGDERKFSSALGNVTKGPPIMPNSFVLWDEHGRARSLELDDLTPFRARLSIPF